MLFFCVFANPHPGPLLSPAPVAALSPFPQNSPVLHSNSELPPTPALTHLNATLTNDPISVASKGLTENLTPLEATLTKNTGGWRSHRPAHSQSVPHAFFVAVPPHYLSSFHTFHTLFLPTEGVTPYSLQVFLPRLPRHFDHGQLLRRVIFSFSTFNCRLSTSSLRPCLSPHGSRNTANRTRNSDHGQSSVRPARSATPGTPVGATNSFTIRTSEKLVRNPFTIRTYKIAPLQTL